MSGLHVPVWRRQMSARIRIVQRRGHVRRQIGRAGRTVQQRHDRDRGQQQWDDCRATVAPAPPTIAASE